jgi:hypothetical protein
MPYSARVRARAATSNWEKRVSKLWGEIDSYDEDDFVDRVDAIVAELPPRKASGRSSAAQRLIPRVTRIARFRCMQLRSKQAWRASVGDELSSRWPARSAILGSRKTHWIS